MSLGEWPSRSTARRGAETGADLKEIRRGWCLDGAEFKEELLVQMTARRCPEHYYAELGEAAEVKAERLVLEELKRVGWGEKELAQRPKGDKVKVKIAQRLRQETTMTLAWIAARLRMGSRGATSNLLNRK